ncbi:MAG: PEP-CTERM sorting domain-containing protein [Caulobacterales bacterium]|nr:PEP-CTERM sorting domain-containing protein [Caulobacterales bacterium]
MSLKNLAAAAALAVLGAAVAAAPASAVTISNSTGQFSVGIGADGELYDAGSGVGFVRSSDGFDPIAPGTPRDSWGVGIVGGASAYADGQLYGSTVASTALTSGAHSAQAVTDTGLGLTVTQAYSFVGAGNILRIDTFVRNDGLDALDVVFQRAVDFDIGDGENVSGPYGASSHVADSSSYGFESPDPNAGPFGYSCFGGCNSTGDLGAAIRISLGNLAGGATSRFSYYYGLNSGRDSLDDLVAQGHAAGAQYIIGAQGAENGDYPSLGANSAILGVGGVPEPATWAMMLMGFFGLGAMVRRRRALAA